MLIILLPHPTSPIKRKKRRKLAFKEKAIDVTDQLA